jgi:CRP-like cAMP-binding protein/ribonuclease BN (tRNA processing enzyme)
MSCLRLPRGGAIVSTSAGAIQLGAPPETIKDALAAGVGVPSIFVLPSVWFSRSRGLTVAELEFPVYYNFFVLGRRVTAVTDERGRRRLIAILRESLFGPAALDPRDYEPSVPAGLRCDFAAEGTWFRRKDGDPERHIALDEALGFALYDHAGVAEIAADVRVERDGSRLRVHDRGRVVAELDDDELAPVPARVQPMPRPFAPPAFGLTVLGSSHGFDPAGKTTGFVLWVNRRGVLVDPPTDATDLLAAAGVPPDAVDAVILTHCHADHDAGVFQKILEAGRVSLYTTPTILGSFLKKYVALSGEPEERLRRLFVFRPVTIGAPLRIQGAEFRFKYTLHPIPTIGFECYFGGRSFAYSADTLYDPARIEAMHREGLIATERRDALVTFPSHCSLVVHEAGVPPIHTPVARLAELPDEIKRRLRVIHVAEAALPAGAGLKLARTGFDETVVLPVAEHPYAEVLEALDALAQVDLLRDFTVERCREFLTIARRETVRAGTLIVGQGEPGDRFYIIVAGEAAVVKDGVTLKQYHEGDFFGETALVTGAPRSADVRARTDLVVLTVDKHDFLALLRGTDLAAALLRLARNRDLPSWDLIDENPVLRALRSRHRTQLQAVLEHRVLAYGELLWDRDAVPEAAWLLDDAVVELADDGQVPIALGRAAFLGDLEAMLRGRRLASRAACVRGGRAFRIAAERLAELCEQSPALMLALSGAQFVI